MIFAKIALPIMKTKEVYYVDFITICTCCDRNDRTEDYCLHLETFGEVNHRSVDRLCDLHDFG